jgi:hypothetical protein
MRWFRTNTRSSGKVALFAMALQFALSFGHVHAEDIYGAQATIAAATHAASAAIAKADKSHPGDQSSKHSDDYCAICATMSLLGNSFVAAPPQLFLPTAFQAIEHIDTAATIFTATRRTAFQSRAPPLA